MIESFFFSGARCKKLLQSAKIMPAEGSKSVVAKDVFCQSIVSPNDIDFRGALALKSGLSMSSETKAAVADQSSIASLDTVVTLVTHSAGNVAYKVTLTDGAVGDIKIFRASGQADIVPLTAATYKFANGNSTLTLGGSADLAVILYFTATGWITLAGPEAA